MRRSLRIAITVGCGVVLLAGMAPVNASRSTSAGSDPASVPSTSQPDPLALGGEGVVAAYTLIVPRAASRSQLQARAVIPSGIRCPNLRIITDGGRHRMAAMDKRSPGATTGAAFADIRACEANLPANVAEARVGTTEIPASLPDQVSKLALLSDTGCRVLGSFVQDCVNGWPLAEISQGVASANPDAIVLIGDFFYREGPCPPADMAKCGGSPPPVDGMPFKDTQYGWMADVLMPMTPLFASAPILVVRGNHEACNRGGNGYFLFFDASPLGADACAPVAGVAPVNITPSWSVDLPTRGRPLRLVTADSAYGQDATISSWVPTQAAEYQRADDLAARGTGPRDVWLLTHRPIFGLVTTDFSTGPTWTPWGSMDQQAAIEGLLDHYQAIFSSHIHVAQAVQIPGEPAQFIIGNGGTLLDPPTGYGIPPFGPLLDGTGNPISPFFAPYPNATFEWTAVEFGYTIATPSNPGGGWSFSFRTPDNDHFQRCDLDGRTVSCDD